MFVKEATGKLKTAIPSPLDPPFPIIPPEAAVQNPSPPVVAVLITRILVPVGAMELPPT